MLDQLNNLSCYFEVGLSFAICIYSILVLLNPDFNCSKGFVSFSFEKVTTGTYNFVSVYLNFGPDGPTIAGLAAASTAISAKTQFLDQVKINSTSQLISGIFKLLQKLLQYFKGIASFAFVNESLSSGVFTTILVLYLKDSELEERGLLGSSLQ